MGDRPPMTEHSVRPVHRTLAYIQTPILAGDLIRLFEGEGGWELTLDIVDGVLQVRT